MDPIMLNAIVTLGGLLVPPVFDLIKKKWLGRDADTPDATMATLATTKPDALAGYVNALAIYTEAQVKFFNRDVIGTASGWVVDLRASIRPIVIVFGMLHMIMAALIPGIIIPQEILLFYEAIIASWFGSRLVLK